ncbi:MAG: T9SS type A sorting domain-containing protein [Sphingobacteriales bacterium]|nr:T9SS type A sorting domain-containing protein [Sphingobacteriales bacterium]
MLNSYPYNGPYMPPCQVNNYCSFEPGGNDYNVVSGAVKIDMGNNDCNENAVSVTNPIIEYDNVEGKGYIIGNHTGKYDFYCNEGTFKLQPQLNDIPYYSVAPAVLNFGNDIDTITQDFCIKPISTYHDLKITLMPLIDARPGFDATYQIIYQNMGTIIENGSIGLQYDASRLEYIYSNSSLAAQSNNLLRWNFENLYPFESRSIIFHIRVNSPQEIPAVNIGDVLSYLAYIDYPQTDETPEDNSSALRQTVIGSCDPNDKICLQGTQIEVKNIDNYLHYVIRFQNTGTAEAFNIVVKDDIPKNLDISTFRMVGASHECRLRLEGNSLEAFFENINLPDSTTNEPESHGFLAFKIKAVDTVGIGSKLENTADIYFDYNFPVITNTTQTEIIETIPDVIGFEDTNSNLLQLSPNPVSNFICLHSIEEIKSVNIYDALGNLKISLQNPDNQIDIQHLPRGIYMLRAIIGESPYSTKFVK